MSLYIDLHVNNHATLSVEITRETGIDRQTDTDGPDTPADEVNTYRWTYAREPGKWTVGHVTHRYGDGAASLAAKVLTAISEYQAV